MTLHDAGNNSLSLAWGNCWSFKSCPILLDWAFGVFPTTGCLCCPLTYQPEHRLLYITLHHGQLAS